MDCVLRAELAEFFILQLTFNLLFILGGIIVCSLADLTFHS